MRSFIWLSASMLLLTFAGCQQPTPPTETNKEVEKANVLTIDSSDVLTSEILTAEEQAKLKPADVLARLKKGNADFTQDALTVRNNAERVRKASLGQFPKAVIVSCLDSRVPVEDVFHSGIGNLFVARVAGNIINTDILGSLEFGCKVSGAKLILVLGHEYCGAIKSAIDNVQLGNITGLLQKIQPAVSVAKKQFKGDATSANPDFVEEVCDENVKLALAEIRNKSSILKEMEAKGEILLVGAVYNMNTGAVEFFQ